MNSSSQLTSAKPRVTALATAAAPVPSPARFERGDTGMPVQSIAFRASRAYELIRSAVRGGQLRDGDGLDARALMRLTGSDLESVQAAIDLLLTHNVLRRNPDATLSTGSRMVQIPVNDLLLGDPTVPGGYIGGALQVLQLEHKVVQSTPVIRERLRTSERMVLLVEQLAMFDGEPLYVRAGYYAEDDNYALSQGIKNADHNPDRPMSVVFEELFGTEIATVHTSLQAVRSEAEVAEHLGTNPLAPVLLRETVITDVNGRVRGLSYTHYRSDRVSISDLTV